MRFSPLTWCGVLVLLLPTRAENWPRFRGPTGQGISAETGVPVTWNSTQNIRWKVPVPVEGWSSPIVWEDRIYLTGTTDNGARCHVLALEAESGKIVWNTEVFEQVPRRKEGKNSYATPTPVTDGQTIFAVFGDGSVAAVDRNGTRQWTNRQTEFYSRHGLGASPLLVDGLLVMPYDGSNRVTKAGDWPNTSDEEKLGWQIPWDRAHLVALDAVTGKRVWVARRGRSRIAHVSPLLVEEPGRQVILSCAGDVIQAFAPPTGELLWTVYSQGEGVTPSPAVGEGLIFTSSGFEKTTLRTVKLGGSGDVTATHIAWEQRKGAPTQPSLLYVKPFLYSITDGGIVHCYRPATGELIYAERIGGNFSASPVYADGRIYFVSEEGVTTVIKAGEAFEIVATNPLDGARTQASMAISGGKFYLRTEAGLWCIGKP